MLQGIFDSHAHYDHEDFDADRNQLLQMLSQQGISYILNAASDLSTSIAAEKLAEKYPFVYASAGVHPHEASTADKQVLETIGEMLSHKKVVALGEIGLDYHYDYSPREIQKEVFEKQLVLAKELDVPVIIHTRKATQDTMYLLKKYRPRGVVHCFSDSAETAKEVIALGMYVGFTGVVTFSNAKKTLEALKAVPLERLVVETDCPYMAPVPHRGKRCDSGMLVDTIAVIANTKEKTSEEIAEITCKNALRLYEISQERE